MIKKKRMRKMKNWFKRNIKKETSKKAMKEIQALKEQLKEELKAEVRQELKDELREEMKAKWLKEQTQKDESSPSQSKASSSVMAELETFNPKRDDRVDQDLKTKEKKKSSPKSKITNFPLIQKEVRHPMPIQRTCSHCHRELLTPNGEIQRNQCKVSATDEKGMCYLACRCGFVSRFYPSTLKIEATGTNPLEMRQAARLFKKEGLIPSRQSLQAD